MANAPWHRIGTVSVTAGSKIVTGVDTLWLGVIGVGDLFTLDGTRWAEVESVTSNTALVLKTAWGGATAANQLYAIARNFTGTVMADLAAALTLMQERYHATLDEMADLYTAAGDVQVTDPEGVAHTVPGWVKLAALIEAALPKAGGAMTGLLTAQLTEGPLGAGSEGATRGFEVKSAGGSGDGAFMAFHRPGSFIAKMGLDIDNQWKVGGWSMGPVAYRLWHEGNDGAGSGLDADLVDGWQASQLAKVQHVGNQDMNIYTPPGLYEYDQLAAGNPSGAPNYRVLSMGADGRTTQLAFQYNDDRAFFRRKTDSTWGEWRELLHTGTQNPTFNGSASIALTGSAPALLFKGSQVGRRTQLYDLSMSPVAHMGSGVDMAGGPYEHSLYYPAVTGGSLTIGSYDGTAYTPNVRITNGGLSSIGPLKPGQYTLATLPAASAYAGYTITVSNATGGPALCLSDGSSWINIRTNAPVN